MPIPLVLCWNAWRSVDVRMSAWVQRNPSERSEGLGAQRILRFRHTQLWLGSLTNLFREVLASIVVIATTAS